MKPRKLIALGGAAAMVLALSAGPADADPAIPLTNDSVDRVFISGSNSTQSLLNALAIAYIGSDGCKQTAVQLPLTVSSPQQNKCNGVSQTGVVTTENYDHDVVGSYYGAEKAGLRQLCAQSDSPPRDARIPFIDIARTTHAPGVGWSCTVASGAATAGVVLRFIAFARDGLDWTHFPGVPNGAAGTPVTNLKQYELHDIFVTCYLSHWNQTQFYLVNPEAPYPAPAGPPIRVWTASATSEERLLWDGFVGGASDSCIPLHLKDNDPADGERIVPPNDARSVERATDDADAAQEKYSIFYTTVSAHNAIPRFRSTSVLGTINEIAPTEDNIRTGTFPAGNFVYNVIRNSGASPVSSGAARRFTMSSLSSNDQTQGWLCKPERAHSEPPGTPGAGVENSVATEDYGKLVRTTIRDEGFAPLIPDTDENSRRCQFSDYTVN